ncbi:hypothetical protein MOX01_31660 [Microbacterium oxydans]|nr:hypothetical protein MOX01_31660 [Microbacterium oxydans]
MYGVSTLKEVHAETVASICHLFALDEQVAAAVRSAAGLDDDPVDLAGRMRGQRPPDLVDVAHFPADAKQILGGADAALAEVPEWRARVVPWLDRAREPSADVLAVVAERLNELPRGVKAASNVDAVVGMARRGEAGDVVSAGFVPQMLIAADHRDYALFGGSFSADDIAAGILRVEPGSRLEIGFLTPGEESAIFGIPVTLANARSTVSTLLVGAARVELWGTTGFDPMCEESTWTEYSFPEGGLSRVLTLIADVLARQSAPEYGELPGSDFADGDFFRVDYLRHGDLWSLSAPHRAIAYDEEEWGEVAQAEVEAFVRCCQLAARSAASLDRHPFASLPDAMRLRRMPVFDPARLLGEDEAFALFDLTPDGRLQCRARIALMESAYTVPLSTQTLGLLERHARDRAVGAVRCRDGALALQRLIASLSADIAERLAALKGKTRVYVSLGRGLTSSPLLEVLLRLGVGAVRSVSLALNAATDAALGDDRLTHCRDGYANAATARIVVDRADAHPSGSLPWAEFEATFVSKWYPKNQVLSAREHVTGVGADVFHFCGHARGNGEVFDNALHLSAELGGPVTAYDILGGEGVWQGTALAVLSGCDAGAGKAHAPLRVRSASVAEALLVRGVRWVLAPAWKVGDQFAAVFTAVFHFVFAQERNPYLALWHARRLASNDFANVAELDALEWHLDRVLGETWRCGLTQQRDVAAVTADVAAFELHERVMLLPLGVPDAVERTIAASRQMTAFRNHVED